jgi:hypothetical protein
VRRGFRVSSASAGAFSQPMSMYSASGNPAESPARPWFRCDQENGALERWLPRSPSTTAQMVTMIATWTTMAMATAVVDRAAPRSVSQSAPPVITSEIGTQEGFQAV